MNVGQRSIVFYVSAVALLLSAHTGLAAGNAVSGAKAFQQCVACHSVKPGEFGRHMGQESRHGEGLPPVFRRTGALQRSLGRQDIGSVACRSRTPHTRQYDDVRRDKRCGATAGSHCLPSGGLGRQSAGGPVFARRHDGQRRSHQSQACRS